jgi:hypothetical protein
MIVISDTCLGDTNFERYFYLLSLPYSEVLISFKVYEIWCFYGVEDDDVVLLGFGAV